MSVDPKLDASVPYPDTKAAHVAQAATASFSATEPEVVKLVQSAETNVRQAIEIVPKTRSEPRSASPQPRRVPIDTGDMTQFAPTIMQSFSNQMIGELLQLQGHLTAEQVEQVLDYQDKHRSRFGEAAIAMGLVKSSDVLWALSKQFGYDYTPVTTSLEAQSFSPDLVVARNPFSRAAEIVRDLRSDLLSNALNPDQKNQCALAVVSLDSGDGKSWLAANLAVSLSQLGGKTLLVDANLRNPRQHELFGVDNPRSGLSGILNRNMRAEVLRPNKALPNLYLLPSGAIPPNPLETLQGRGFLELMHKLRVGFTHVIVDTPAAASSADARLVAARCGASLLVARRNKSSLPALKDMAQLLSKGNARFAGLVINEI